jgi:hypothetical protein
MRSDLPIAGFAVIEAADLDEAVALISTTRCAVAHGVVEAWPLETAPPESLRERNRSVPLAPVRACSPAAASIR